MLSKRTLERSAQLNGESCGPLPSRQINLHESEDLANIDDINEYTAFNQSLSNRNDGEQPAYAPDILLAHMSG
jgi:hypothetical protein